MGYTEGCVDHKPTMGTYYIPLNFLLLLLLLLLLSSSPHTHCRLFTYVAASNLKWFLRYGRFRYKAFQLKFCPMVVNRAMTLNCDPSARPKGYWLHALLAPFYSMGQ